MSTPTRDEITTLPRGAQVAFAARCARHVRHLATSEDESIATHAGACGRAAKRALCSAAVVAGHETEDGCDRVALNTGVTHSAVDAVRMAMSSGGVEMAPRLRADFDLLASLAREQTWDDETPVPPDVFDQLGTAM